MSYATESTDVNWDEYARCYEAVRYLSAYMAMLRTVLDRCPLKPGSVVLDAGCGTGNLTEMLTTQTSGIELHAYDASSAMLDRAKERCLGRNVFFKLHNLNDPLPLQSNSIDIITSVNVLYALADPLKAVADWYRVLRPGGSVVISTPKSGFEMGFILRAEVEESPQPESFWRGISESLDREIGCVYEAFTDPVIRETMSNLARYNKRIVAAGRTTKFHFFNQMEISETMRSCPWASVVIGETYANQNWLITLEK